MPDKPSSRRTTTKPCHTTKHSTRKSMRTTSTTNTALHTPTYGFTYRNAEFGQQAVQSGESFDAAPAVAKRTTTLRAKGGSNVKTPVAAKPSSWKNFKNAAYRVVKRVKRQVGPHRTKGVVQKKEENEEMILRKQLRAIGSEDNTGSLTKDADMYLLMAAALALFAVRVTNTREPPVKKATRLVLNLLPRRGTGSPGGLSAAPKDNYLWGGATIKVRCPICSRLQHEGLPCPNAKPADSEQNWRGIRQRPRVQHRWMGA